MASPCPWRLTSALTREQKGREAPLLQVGVERDVSYQFILSAVRTEETGLTPSSP